MQTIIFQKTFIIGYETKKDKDQIKILELIASEGKKEDEVEMKEETITS